MCGPKGPRLFLPRDRNVVNVNVSIRTIIPHIGKCTFPGARMRTPDDPTI